MSSMCYICREKYINQIIIVNIVLMHPWRAKGDLPLGGLSVGLNKKGEEEKKVSKFNNR